MHGKENGKRMLRWWAKGPWNLEHYLGHPEYNKAVLDALGELRRIVDDLTPEQTAKKLEDISTLLRRAINSGDYGPWQ